jgi:hypothetical protein
LANRHPQLSRRPMTRGSVIPLSRHASGTRKPHCSTPASADESDKELSPESMRAVATSSYEGEPNVITRTGLGCHDCQSKLAQCKAQSGTLQRAPAGRWSPSRGPSGFYSLPASGNANRRRRRLPQWPSTNSRSVRGYIFTRGRGAKCRRVHAKSSSAYRRRTVNFSMLSGANIKIISTSRRKAS